MITTTKRTTDIYFASALSALGATLESVDKTDVKHMVFEFSLVKPDPVQEPLMAAITTGKDLDVWENQWANKSLFVNAVDYAEAIKRLKSVVHTK